MATATEDSLAAEQKRAEHAAAKKALMDKSPMTPKAKSLYGSSMDFAPKPALSDAARVMHSAEDFGDAPVSPAQRKPTTTRLPAPTIHGEQLPGANRDPGAMVDVLARADRMLGSRTPAGPPNAMTTHLGAQPRLGERATASDPTNLFNRMLPVTPHPREMGPHPEAAHPEITPESYLAGKTTHDLKTTPTAKQFHEVDEKIAAKELGGFDPESARAANAERFSNQAVTGRRSAALAQRKASREAALPQNVLRGMGATGYAMLSGDPREVVDAMLKEKQLGQQASADAADRGFKEKQLAQQGTALAQEGDQFGKKRYDDHYRGVYSSLPETMTPGEKHLAAKTSADAYVGQSEPRMEPTAAPGSPFTLPPTELERQASATQQASVTGADPKEVYETLGPVMDQIAARLEGGDHQGGVALATRAGITPEQLMTIFDYAPQLGSAFGGWGPKAPDEAVPYAGKFLFGEGVKESATRKRRRGTAASVYDKMTGKKNGQTAAAR